MSRPFARTRSRWQLRLERGLLLVGALGLLLWATGTLERVVAQHYLAWRFESVAARHGDDAGARTDPALADEGRGAATEERPEAAGPPILGRVEIPRVGVSAMVLEGIAATTLRRAVGHLPNTPRPGSPGNAALAGHRDTFFRTLEQVTYGDRIRFITAAETHEFVVEAVQIVDERNLAVLSPTDDPTLTLITCYPFDYVGLAPKRWVVHARLLNGPATD